MLKRKSSLKIINKISIFKNLIKKLQNQKNKKPVILIPTMGALHQGHLSLIKKGKKNWWNYNSDHFYQSYSI